MNPLFKKQGLDEMMVMWNDPSYIEHQHHSDPDYTTQNGKMMGKGTEVEEGSLMVANEENPFITNIPSAADEPDVNDATFFKEGEPYHDLTPAEEKITASLQPYGFNYGARVSDGTILWFRGSQERVSYDTKTGTVTYYQKGQPILHCPVNDLREKMKQFRDPARAFHEDLKKALGQDKEGAVRPSPHDVFNSAISQSTGLNQTKQKHQEPEDSSDKSKEIVTEIGDAIGVQTRTAKTASKYGDKLKKMKARRDPDNIEEYGTAASGFASGGPFSCSMCVWKDKQDDEVVCTHPKVKADPELVSLRAASGNIKVDANDCCRYVKPEEEKEKELPEGWHVYDAEGEEVKTASCHHQKTAAVTKSYGTGTPLGGTPNAPGADELEDEEEDDSVVAAKTADVDIKETPRHLPPRDDMRRHLDKDVQEEVMEGVMDGVEKVADDQWELDREEEFSQESYVDALTNVREEAKDAFMQDPFMLQDASDQNMTMDQLWEEVGEAFTNEYQASTYAKQGTVQVEESVVNKCPNCKSDKRKAVADRDFEDQNLQECLGCGRFYELQNS